MSEFEFLEILRRDAMWRAAHGARSGPARDRAALLEEVWRLRAAVSEMGLETERALRDASRFFSNSLDVERYLRGVNSLRVLP